jgi:very-short-patch-repair endonuclease
MKASKDLSASKDVKQGSAQSELETAFAYYTNMLISHIPLEREYKVIPDRKYRFDFVHVESKVAIELQGGIYGTGKRRGAHIRPQGYERDCEKNNLAALHGWVVLAFTSGMLDKNPSWCCELVERVIVHRMQDIKIMREE